jgi:hypothetical protein
MLRNVTVEFPVISGKPVYSHRQEPDEQEPGSVFIKCSASAIMPEVSPPGQYTMPAGTLQYLPHQ